MVTHEMVLLRIEDISAYAEARALKRRIDDLSRGVRRERQAAALAMLGTAAAAACATVAEALRAVNPREEVRRLRDATLALAELRAGAWDAHGAGHLRAPAFDELMAGAARCLKEVAALEASCRHRGRRQIDLGE